MVEHPHHSHQAEKPRHPHLWTRIKPKKIHFRHYFGGAAFLLMLVQLLTGLYMIFYYEPTLRETYKTVQYFTNTVFLGSFTRNVHRYGAFIIGIAAFVHLATGYFRKDFQGGRKTYWLTGVLLGLVLVGFLISGTILPWEWKGYWLMEMFNNWLKNIPIFGDKLYYFFMTTYTPTRNFVIHDIILPIITFILLEIHCLARIRARGFNDYLIRQTVAIIPLLIALVSLSVIYPIPTQDPEVVPFPMEGVYIPAPEWFIVTFFLPYWYLAPRQFPMYLFWGPAIFTAVITMLPYIVRKRYRKDETHPDRKGMLYRWIYAAAGAAVVVLLVAGFMWGSVKQPWMGCNSCHNLAMGDRMGIPPVTFKDTTKNPLVLDNRWMERHWYEPQVVW